MACDDNYLYTSPWFYLFLLTLILFLIFIILIENDDNLKNGMGTPMWIWLMFIFLIIVLFGSFILYYYHVKNYECLPVVKPLYYETVPFALPMHLSEEPCSIPVYEEHYVKEEIYYDNDITTYQFTDADVNIPFNALNPFT